MNAKFVLAAICFALFATEADASKLYISEYTNITYVNGVVAQIGNEPSTDQAPVDFSGGAASSLALQASTKLVRVICDAQCSIKVSKGTTVANTNKVLPALMPEYFGVPPGQAYKISVIANP